MADAPTRVTITGGSAAPANALPQPDFQPQESFQQRLLQFAITLAPNQGTGQPVSFAGTKSNTITLEGFRASVRIENSGAPSKVSARALIYGLNDSTMQQLAVLGIIFNSIQKNAVTIGAGNPNSGFSSVFGGTIWSSMPDYNQAPNVPFILQAQSGYINQVVPIPASSFPQTTDVATMMAGFAAQIPVGFENNGVTVQMPPSYFPGTLIQQIQRCARAAHINAELVDGNTKLAIWPIGGSRTSLTSVPLVSKETGMIGYPTLSPNGYMIVRKLFDPQIAFGGEIQVVSSRVPQANRNWVVQKLDLELDSMIPKGQWRQIMYCYPKGYAAPPPPPVGSSQ
jgi:hypothetical protein